MDPPKAAEVDEKTGETKGSGNGYPCGLCDTEIVYKIAEELLPGLASACVDNTTGGIFKSAGSVAVDMRKEMVDYLTQRSETYVAEFILAEVAPDQQVSEHPYDIITNLIDDFSSSKRNMFSRVSEWVSSDRREDRIDDFVQEMEINGFWLLARRESVAAMLLKNVDYKNACHCDVVCSSEEEVEEHRSKCKFRPMNCENEGCTNRYCAAQKENHEAICPFMILPCEQKCSDYVMRREMDRHCVTVCPMKLVNCAFYTVGCGSSIPRCNVEKHNAENLSTHLFYILQTAHKDATDEELICRVEQSRSKSNTEKLARARDARALTYLIKDVEAKLGPIEVKTKPDVSESKERHTIKEESTKSPNKENTNKKGSPTKTESSSTEKPAIVKEEQSVSTVESPSKMESKTEKPDTGKEDGESPTKKEVSRELPKEEEDKESPRKETLEKSSHNEEEASTKSANRETDKEESSNNVEKESAKSPNKETSKESSSSDEEDSKKSPKKETIKESPSGHEESTKSPKKEKVKESSSSDEEEESKKSPKEKTTKESSSSDEEQSMKSPSGTER